MDFCIWLVILGCQKHSSNRDTVWSQPWCPASLWHPFRVRVVTQCAFGTTNSSRSLLSPLGIECRYRAFWWIMLSSVDSPRSVGPPHWRACSPKSVFRSVFFGASIQSETALNTRIFSLGFCPISHMHLDWYACPVATQTSCSKSWSPSTMVGSLTSALCAAPRSCPIEDRSHCIWVEVGSNPAQHICYAVIAGPFWYSNWKLNLARAPTHQWPVGIEVRCNHDIG